MSAEDDGYVRLVGTQIRMTLAQIYAGRGSADGYRVARRIVREVLDLVADAHCREDAFYLASLAADDVVAGTIMDNPDIYASSEVLEMLGAGDPPGEEHTVTIPVCPARIVPGRTMAAGVTKIEENDGDPKGYRALDDGRVVEVDLSPMASVISSRAGIEAAFEAVTAAVDGLVFDAVVEAVTVEHGGAPGGLIDEAGIERLLADVLAEPDPPRRRRPWWLVAVVLAAAAAAAFAS